MDPASWRVDPMSCTVDPASWREDPIELRADLLELGTQRQTINIWAIKSVSVREFKRYP